MVSTLTTIDVQDLFQLRSLLETSAAALAAENASNETLQDLRESAEFTYMYGDWESYQAFRVSSKNSVSIQEPSACRVCFSEYGKVREAFPSRVGPQRCSG